MKKFEYKLEKIKREKGIIEKLNKLGEIGWEISDVFMSERELEIIFKREIENKNEHFDTDDGVNSNIEKEYKFYCNKCSRKQYEAESDGGLWKGFCIPCGEITRFNKI